MMRLLILIIFCAQTFSSSVGETERVAPGCVINVVGDEPNISPLVADFSGNFMDPLALNDLRVHFDHDATFWIACPGGTFTSPVPIISRGQLAVCQGGTTIAIEGRNLSYSDISCNLDQSARPYLLHSSDGDPCEVSGTVTTIGYDCSGGPLPVYRACMHTQNSLAFYVKYIISRWANTLRGYTPCNHIKTFDETLPPLYERNFTKGILKTLGYDDDLYLAEGQLAATNDFFYPFQRDATSCYTNTAPQWNTFKEGNWAAVERSITTLVRQGANGDFIAYSGTLGITSIEDRRDGGVIDLFLDTPKLPVPRWFWKLIYSPTTGSGNIIVGYNNPYITSKEDVDFEFIYTVCLTDQLPTLTWLTGIDNTNPQLGYIYGCLFNEVIEAGMFEVVQNLLRTETKNFIGSLH